MGKGKRLFDLVTASGALVLFSPLFAAIAAAIKLDDGGPVFFRQVRVGRQGGHFRIWKFRTMVTDAERRGTQLTTSVDPRVTRVGRWLRRSKLDEIPSVHQRGHRRHEPGRSTARGAALRRAVRSQRA
jgi:lipopolysaccharide/colanic/teichoic acid biosynthesis glycosyltransferase